MNALVARGHPRLSNLVAASKDVDGRDKPDKPGHDDPGAAGRSLFQDRLTVGCDVLTVAMQVRALLLDPTSSNHVAVTGTATAAPAKRVHAGSSPARNSNPRARHKGAVDHSSRDVGRVERSALQSGVMSLW